METFNILISLHHVLRDTCTVHGKGIKTRYFGSILILESKKDQCSIKQDRTKLFLKEHFQPIRVPRLSPRRPPKIPLKHDHNWTEGNDQSGFTVEQQPVGKLVQQSPEAAPHVNLSKPTQSKPNVEELNLAPHIHEQMTWSKYVYMATTLRTILRTTTSCLSTMR